MGLALLLARHRRSQGWRLVCHASPSIPVADWPKGYTLDQNRMGINARLVLEIVCNRLEGAQTHAKLWSD
jgi:hypothetical protein